MFFIARNFPFRPKPAVLILPASFLYSAQTFGLLLFSEQTKISLIPTVSQKKIAKPTKKYYFSHQNIAFESPCASFMALMFWLINLGIADDATSIMSKFYCAYFIVVLQQIEELSPLVFVMTIYKYGGKVFSISFCLSMKYSSKSFLLKAISFLEKTYYVPYILPIITKHGLCT